MHNARKLYAAMLDAIDIEQYERQASDPESPQGAMTYEAAPGCRFELLDPRLNVCGAIDEAWAVANTLHFFSGSEEAEMLEKYNKHASRFVTEGVWHGAYGAIAMPQVNQCIERLTAYPNSRRAIVSMGENSPQDINRPACWSFLQFLQTRRGLNMLVYQRSLHLKVMPYDLIVLSNLLMHVAERVNLTVGSLIWTIGSLHATELTMLQPSLHTSLRIAVASPEDCLTRLRGGL